MTGWDKCIVMITILRILIESFKGTIISSKEM